MDKLPHKSVKCTAFLPLVANGLAMNSSGLIAQIYQNEIQ